METEVQRSYIICAGSGSEWWTVVWIFFPVLLTLLPQTIPISFLTTHLKSRDLGWLLVHSEDSPQSRFLTALYFFSIRHIFLFFQRGVFILNTIRFVAFIAQFSPVKSETWCEDDKSVKLEFNKMLTLYLNYLFHFQVGVSSLPVVKVTGS